LARPVKNESAPIIVHLGMDLQAIIDIVKINKNNFLQKFL